MPVKVLIVDDHPVFLAGLRALLEMNKDIEIVGEAKDGKQAIDLQNQLNPDVVVMDINMPGMNGIEATKKILSENPEVKILALSIHSNKRFVQGMLGAGAKGYLLKVAVPEELILAIQKLARGDRYLSSAITSIALSIEEGKNEKAKILSTKLHRPSITKEHVKRSHLLELLNRNSYKPATLISAGAGYGKSSLISSWLEETKTPHAWVSLSEDDNDFRNFISCLSAAILKSFPNVLKEINELIEVASLPQVEHISENLINSLDEIDEEFVLVLDDYHHIKNNDINRLLSDILRFPPELMHLVIITRRDPYLDLSSLRAHSRLNEIRMNDLCFREDEIFSLFENLLNTKLIPDTVRKLMQQTEGWITGLRLASLTVQAGEDANKVFQVINPNTPTTTNFLLKEVISNQSEHIQNALIQISILDRFCDELIDWLCISQFESSTSEITGQQIIQTLIDANLFTISLDYEQKWYRFHHLFQDLLKSQLKENRSIGEIKSYHLKVSLWFDQKGLMEEAVKNAIKADDIQKAVDLHKRYRYDLINSEQMHRLDQLVNLFQEEVIANNPALLSSRAFYMDFSGMVPEMMEYKEKALAILNQVSSDLQEENAIKGEIELLDGVFYIVYGEWENLIRCSKNALELLPDQAERFLLNAIGYQVVGFQMLLGLESGMEKIKDLLIKYPIRTNFAQVAEQLWYSLVYAMWGDKIKLKTSGLKLFNLGEKYRFIESVIYGRYFISYAYYMANEPEKAEPYLIKAVNGSYVHRIHYIVNCAFMLASIHIDRGEIEKADKLMELVLEKTAEAGSETVVTMVKAMQVELAIKDRSIHKALELNDNMNYNAIVHRGWLCYIPQLTPIKLKLALNTKDDIVDAQKQLDKYQVLNLKTNRIPIQIEILILQAVAFQSQNMEKEAILRTTEALTLSSTGNCIRTFIEFGAPLKNLIASISNTFEDKDFVRKILAGIKERESKLIVNKERESENKTRPLTKNALPEELSFREIEVLQLAAKGLRNKEISDALCVQTNTIKKHMKNIFAKLNVSSRIKAAKKAEELGIIESV